MGALVGAWGGVGSMQEEDGGSHPIETCSQITSSLPLLELTYLGDLGSWAPRVQWKEASGGVSKGSLKGLKGMLKCPELGGTGKREGDDSVVVSCTPPTGDLAPGPKPRHVS